MIVTILLCCTLLLVWLRTNAHRPTTQRERHTELTDQIDQLLPQTQCGDCGFAACRPYAQAIALGRADINRCPPGGEHTLRALAHLTGKYPTPLIHHEPPGQVARIDEQQCIGCVKCIDACPVDAIIGARKQLHSVIPELCTGCQRCLPPCPVDCISLVETS